MAKILIIEDDAFVADSITLILQKAKHSVLVTGNDAFGLKTAREQCLDIAIIDIFPTKARLDLVGTLIATYPKVPVLAMSASVSIKGLDPCHFALRMGAKRVLLKPFTNAELLETVDACLRLKR